MEFLKQALSLPFTRMWISSKKNTCGGKHYRVLSKSEMELNVKKTSSQALLSCGNGGGLDAFYFFLFCQNVRRVGLGTSTDPKLHIRTGKPASVSASILLLNINCQTI